MVVYLTWPKSTLVNQVIIMTGCHNYHRMSQFNGCISYLTQKHPSQSAPCQEKNSNFRNTPCLKMVRRSQNILRLCLLPLEIGISIQFDCTIEINLSKFWLKIKYTCNLVFIWFPDNWKAQAFLQCIPSDKINLIHSHILTSQPLYLKYLQNGTCHIENLYQYS